MTNKLKPCRCGRKVTGKEGKDGYFSILCLHCFAFVAAISKADAIAAWNRRVEDKPE